MDSTKLEAESDRGSVSNPSKAKKTGKIKKREKFVPPSISGADAEDSNKEGKKKRRRGQKKRLVMCVAQTKYFVVRYVGKKLFKMKLTRADEEDWDICWQDGAVQCEQL